MSISASLLVLEQTASQLSQVGCRLLWIGGPPETRPQVHQMGESLGDKVQDSSSTRPPRGDTHPGHQVPPDDRAGRRSEQWAKAGLGEAGVTSGASRMVLEVDEARLGLRLASSELLLRCAEVGMLMSDGSTC